MPEQELSQEQLQGGAEIASAGVQAAAREPEPAKKRAAASRAIRKKAEEKGEKLNEEEAGMIADAIIDKMDSRGVFAPPPEPVTHPPTAPAETATAHVDAELASRPIKRTWAEKFRGQ